MREHIDANVEQRISVEGPEIPNEVEAIVSNSAFKAHQSAAIPRGLGEHQGHPGAVFVAESPERDRLAEKSVPTQADRVHASALGAISFGHFRLFPAQRLLLHRDYTVPLGSRALDILIALVERSGELLGKDELMARVWPNTFVEPSNLTVHIATLRRALGDGRDGNRFIVNIPGRGYQFVEPVRTLI